MAGRTALGPIRGPASSAAGVSPGPSPRLPPPRYQRPVHLRQAPATLALRLLLRGDRRHDLLGHHDPQPPRRVDPTRRVRQAQTDRVGVLRPVRRPRPRSHRCGRLHHQGARRQRGRWPVTGRPRQTGPETLRLEERGFHGRIAHKGENAPIQASRRGHVERTHAWQSAFYRLARCYERRATVIDAFFDLAERCAAATTRRGAMGLASGVHTRRGPCVRARGNEQVRGAVQQRASRAGQGAQSVRVVCRVSATDTRNSSVSR